MKRDANAYFHERPLNFDNMHSRDAASKLKSRGERIDLRDSWVTEPPHNGPQMQEL